MTDVTYDRDLDVRGLSCPRPLLKAKQTLEEMQSGQILRVIADDSTTKSTFPPFLKRSGDEMLAMEENDGLIIHYIRKK